MFKLFVLIISTVLTAVVVCAQSDTFNTTCSPFRLLVIWHTSNGEDHAFIQQKRLIMQLLQNIPEGTEIHVTAINTQRYHLLHFKKNKTMDWIYNISLYNPEILENHIFNGSLINETVFTFRKQNDKKEVAELTILVVSEETLTENSFEMIKNMKRCVVFTGLSSPPPSWTSLATDRQHVVMLNTTSESLEENISGTADTVLDLLCRDSRLICDSDEFWTGKRCVSCSFICSADTQKLQDICVDLCPYYSQLSLENADNEADKNVTCECDNAADKNDTGQRDKTHTDWIVLLIFVLLTVITVVIVAVCVKFRKTSRAHDTFEFRAQQRSFIYIH